MSVKYWTFFLLGIPESAVVAGPAVPPSQPDDGTPTSNLLNQEENPALPTDVPLVADKSTSNVDAEGLSSPCSENSSPVSSISPLPAKIHNCDEKGSTDSESNRTSESELDMEAVD